MADSRYRVLAIASHVVQYMSPIFRRMAAHPQLDLQVAYCSMRGAEPAHDAEFGMTVRWDVPLLDGYSWVQVPNRGKDDGTFWGLRNPELASIIRGGHFDAVLCYTGYVCATFWIARSAAKQARVPFIFGTDATTLAPRDGRAWKLQLKKLTWPRLYSLADQVIVPSTGTRDMMRSLGIPDDRITRTPYSVDNDWWFAKSAEVDRAAVRASWGAAPDTRVILYCAKLQPWKRPQDLLGAFAQARLPGAILVFAGEGPMRAQLEQQATQLGVRDQVRFLGFLNQSQLPPVYTAADVMVLPSEYEPFAVVVNEAYCCGCPVIASDRVGAACDLVAPVDPQLIYPCGDVPRLAQTLSQLLSSPQRLAQTAAAARRRILEWSPEANIEATVEAIRIARQRMFPNARKQPAAGAAEAEAEIPTRRTTP